MQDKTERYTYALKPTKFGCHDNVPRWIEKINFRLIILNNVGSTCLDACRRTRAPSLRALLQPQFSTNPENLAKIGPVEFSGNRE